MPFHRRVLRKFRHAAFEELPAADSRDIQKRPLPVLEDALAVGHRIRGLADALDRHGRPIINLERLAAQLPSAS